MGHFLAFLCPHKHLQLPQPRDPGVTFQNASVPTKGTPSQPGVPSALESSSQGSRKTKEGVAFRPRESPHVFFSLEQTRVQEFKEVRLCSCTRTSRP